jgi:hypothetical protein
MSFAGLSNNGVFGGCWCMGFHPDDSREPALNRDRKLARVRAGRAHVGLVFDGDECVGWRQFGAPDEVPKIKNRAVCVKGATLPDWRIACNFVDKAPQVRDQLGIRPDGEDVTPQCVHDLLDAAHKHVRGRDRSGVHRAHQRVGSGKR